MGRENGEDVFRVGQRNMDASSPSSGLLVDWALILWAAIFLLFGNFNAADKQRL